MRAAALRLAAPLLLGVVPLVACTGGDGATPLGELVVTSVAPERVSREGATVTVTGENLVEVIAGRGFGGELSVTVCGVPLTDVTVAGEVRTIVAPPARGVTVRQGDTLTGTFPAGGDVTSRDVTVGRPDGQTVTIEDVVTCFDPAPTVDAFAVEPDLPEAGQPTTFAWSVASPAGAGIACTLDPGDGSAPYAIDDCLATSGLEHTFVTKGTYTATLTATDDANRATRRELVVSVGNTPPSADPASLTTAEDTPVAFRLAATDPDGDDLAYAITAPPTHGRLDGSAPELTYTPSPDWSGTDTFGFSVSDGHGGVDAATITIRVAPVDDPPRITAFAVATDDVHGDRVASFTWTVTDPDDDEVACELDHDGDGVAEFVHDPCATNTMHEKVMLFPDVDAEYVPHLTVTDATSRVDATAPRVTVRSHGIAPLASNYQTSLAIREDGTVVAWGTGSYGATDVPEGLSDVEALAAGDFFGVALRSDGSVAAWGHDSDGQATVPAGLTDATSVAAGYFHALALRSDGTVVAWGSDEDGQTSVPAGLADVVDVAATDFGSFAVRRDGTVATWGLVPAWVATTSDVVAVAGNFVYNAIALRADGSVVTGSSGASPPGADADVVAIAAGDSHGLALRRDGTVVAWGADDEGQATVPAGLSGVVAIAAGSEHSLALLDDGTVVGWGDDAYGQTAPQTGILLP